MTNDDNEEPVTTANEDTRGGVDEAGGGSGSATTKEFSIPSSSQDENEEIKDMERGLRRDGVCLVVGTDSATLGHAKRLVAYPAAKITKQQQASTPMAGGGTDTSTSNLGGQHPSEGNSTVEGETYHSPGTPGATPEAGAAEEERIPLSKRAAQYATGGSEELNSTIDEGSRAVSSRAVAYAVDEDEKEKRNNTTSIAKRAAAYANNSQELQPELQRNDDDDDDDDTNAPSALPPPPPRNPLGPGAYSAEHGNMERRDNIDFTMAVQRPQANAQDEEDEEEEGIMNHPNTTAAQDNTIVAPNQPATPPAAVADTRNQPPPLDLENPAVDGFSLDLEQLEVLAQAMPIDEDTDLQSLAEQSRASSQATPVNPDEEQKKREKERRKKLSYLFLIAVFICAAAASTVGIVVHQQTKKAAKEPAPTLAPTNHPTMPPTETPSLAPTGILDLLLTDLPNSTKQNIMDPSTPQWQAWNWLGNHRNITNLDEWRKKQLFALATIYYAFDGPNWGNGLNEDWLDDSRHECFWFSSDWTSLSHDTYQGFQGSKSCNQTTGEFRILDLTGVLRKNSNPAHSIPPEIGLLSHLVAVELSKNNLNVSLSQFIGPALPHMSEKLTVLSLNYNMLRGTIPTQLATLTRLKSVALFSNDLSGPIPSEFALMTDLSFLRMFGNNLSVIPTEIGLMTSLSTLWLSSNRFMGPFPSAIGLLTKLTDLTLENNELSGTIPPELGRLIDLEDLFLDENYLSGSIPRELMLLQKLNLLNLKENFLSGPLPTTNGEASNLYWLALNSNTLSGKLPSELGLLTSLEIMDLDHNLFFGSLPTQLGLLNETSRLRLNNNAFSGGIPSELGALHQLTELKMQSNSFSGQIPTSWGNVMRNASELGPMPVFSFANPTFPNLPTHLQEVDLSNNPLLSGTVAEDLCSLNSVCAVYVMDFSIPQWKEGECSLKFDCTELLCGCNCTCTPQSNTPNTTRLFSGV